MSTHIRLSSIHISNQITISIMHGICCTALVILIHFCFCLIKRYLFLFKKKKTVKILEVYRKIVFKTSSIIYSNIQFLFIYLFFYKKMDGKVCDLNVSDKLGLTRKSVSVVSKCVRLTNLLSTRDY